MLSSALDTRTSRLQYLNGKEEESKFFSDGWKKKRADYEFCRIRVLGESDALLCKVAKYRIEVVAKRTKVHLLTRKGKQKISGGCKASKMPVYFLLLLFSAPLLFSLHFYSLVSISFFFSSYPFRRSSRCENLRNRRVLGWWIAQMQAVPDAATFSIALITRSAPALSSEVVGSSEKKRGKSL